MNDFSWENAMQNSVFSGLWILSGPRIRFFMADADIYRACQYNTEFQ